jgi:hypothetical protein
MIAHTDSSPSDSHRRSVPRLLLVLLCTLALTSCRLDVTVDVDMQPDGTGTVTVEAVADAELVDQVPDLVDDLRLDDAIANGWVVEGPTPLEGGSMSIRLVHDFHSAEELASVLNSIGPPLTDMQAARTTDPNDPGGPTTNAIDGTLVLPNGYESFADAALVEAVGGQPFGEQISASGLTPEQAMSFTFRVGLPGELVSSETGTEVDGGVIEWTAPLDGTSVDLLTQTVQRPAGSGNSWAEPVSNLALVLLVVWLAVSVAFIVFVVVARRSKRRRRERALRALSR